MIPGMNTKHAPASLLALSLVSLALLPVGCKSPDAGPKAGPETAPMADATDAWSDDFDPPRSLRTARLRLEPLGPEHAALDHAAFMSSRAHLHRTMHWGSWPSEDMTVEQNRGDLERHAREFADREGYAYTVLTLDGSACRGCVYLNPIEGQPRAMSFAYWVTADGVEMELDAELHAAVVEWIDEAWPVDHLVQPIHEENDRGAELAKSLGFDAGAVEGKRTAWGRAM
jgi:hypothetical protein